IVVLDSATPAITAAVASVTDTVEVLAERVTVDARAHGELLAPSVDAVLRAAGIGPRDLTAVVAGLGPGPFTGLRVGLVTAAGLAALAATRVREKAPTEQLVPLYLRRPDAMEPGAPKAVTP